MRRRRNLFAVTLSLALGLASAACVDAQPPPESPPRPPPKTQAPDPLRALREAVEQTRDEAALRTRLQALAPELGATLSERAAREGRRSFRLTFATPLPARRLIGVMGWERPYAISGDVHQRGWSLRLWTGDIDDRYGPRIAAHTPHVGAWAMDPSLDDRPEGELPRLHGGGSPAYDLLREYDASVTSIELELWSPGWQLAERMEVPEGDKAPEFALSSAAIKGWLEAHKGFGYPRYLDSGSTASDMRVLAAWNIPTSGLNWTYYWVYCLSPTAGWTLLTSDHFVPPVDQAHSAVLDAEKDEVRFLGSDGTTYHRVSVTACEWNRP